MVLDTTSTGDQGASSPRHCRCHVLCFVWFLLFVYFSLFTATFYPFPITGLLWRWRRVSVGRMGWCLGGYAFGSPSGAISLFACALLEAWNVGLLLLDYCIPSTPFGPLRDGFEDLGASCCIIWAVGGRQADVGRMGRKAGLRQCLGTCLLSPGWTRAGGKIVYIHSSVGFGLGCWRVLGIGMGALHCFYPRHDFSSGLLVFVSEGLGVAWAANSVADHQPSLSTGY